MAQKAYNEDALREFANLKRKAETQYIKTIAQYCIDSYYVFYREFWEYVSTDEYVDNWHIREICGVLQEAGLKLARGENKEKDIDINIPPGMSKSTMVTELFPVWLWLHNPRINIINSSYSADISIDHSTRSKQAVGSDKWNLYFDAHFLKTHGKPLRITKSLEKDWRNNFGGGRYATSTGGSVTGVHGDLILRDDPINPEQATSEAYRKRALRYNNRTLSMRKKNKETALTITVMQRLHEDDQTGYDLENNPDGITHICLPATITDYVSPEAWRKYYKDGLLDTNRLSQQVLDETYATLGAYSYSGQMQQRPSPEGGGILKKEWFVIIEPADVPQYITRDMFMDTAYTEKKDNDPTGFLTTGKDAANNRIIVFDYKSELLAMPKLLKRYPELRQANGLEGRSMTYVEPKASGKSFVQLIQAETMHNISDIKSDLIRVDKTARANYIAPFAESSRIILVRGNWNDGFLDELTDFPNAKHDESIDILAYACDHYFMTKKKRGVKRQN